MHVTRTRKLCARYGVCRRVDRPVAVTRALPANPKRGDRPRCGAPVLQSAGWAHGSAGLMNGLMTGQLGRSSM